MKLFGHPDSGHAFKVKLLLEHAGIAHDYERVDIFAPRETRPAEFRNGARFGEVPLLLHEGRAYVQSDAILLHLAAHTGRFGAEDEGTFARCREWLFWETNRLGMCLPQLRLYHRFDDHGIDEGAYRWLAARYALDVARLDAELADGREWIVAGDTPSVADFSLCGYLVHAEEAKVVVPANVVAWLERLAVLPGWRHPYELLR